MFSKDLPPVEPEPEPELVEIVIQVLGTNGTLMSAQQASLEQRDGQVDAGKQVFPKLARMMDYLVAIPEFPQPAVAFPSIGLDGGARLIRHPRVLSFCICRC